MLQACATHFTRCPGSQGALGADAKATGGITASARTRKNNFVRPSCNLERGAWEIWFGYGILLVYLYYQIDIGSGAQSGLPQVLRPELVHHPCLGLRWQRWLVGKHLTVPTTLEELQYQVDLLVLRTALNLVEQQLMEHKVKTSSIVAWTQAWPKQHHQLLDWHSPHTDLSEGDLTCLADNVEDEVKE